jgi:hypothetical protein
LLLVTHLPQSPPCALPPRPELVEAVVEPVEVVVDPVLPPAPVVVVVPVVPVPPPEPVVPEPLVELVPLPPPQPTIAVAMASETHVVTRKRTVISLSPRRGADERVEEAEASRSAPAAPSG